jgi:hypothetical protein
MATQISKNDLIQLLDKTSAETITIVQRREAKMNKTNNPFYHKEGRKMVPDYKVEKQSKVTYLYGGGSYEERVNEALRADGSTNEFTGSGLRWGEWFIQNKVILYQGQFYVRAYVDKGNTPDVEYFVDDKPATEQQIKDIKEFEIESSGSAKQANEGLSEEKQIIPNNIRFDTIVTIEIDGTEYEII